MLELRSISKSITGLRILNNLTRQFRGGAVYGLIGPNGAGKTTLFNVVTGFIGQDEGQVVFDGKPIDPLPPEARWHLGISRSFQEGRLAESLTASENIGLAVRNQEGETATSALSKMARVKANDRHIRAMVADLLSDWGLSSIADKKAAILSFGQRRLVSIACCMIAEPKLLLLDEPAAGLSPAIKQRLKSLITSYSIDHQACVIVIEHDLEFVREVSTSTLVINKGEIIAEGAIDELRNNALVVETYLGGIIP